MKLATLPLVFLLTFLTVQAAPQEGWTDLLAGDSLDAWIFDVRDYSDPGKIWSLKDGVLRTDGAGKKTPTGVIRSKDAFQNFELELEWRWPDQPGNCGVLLFCSTPRFMSIWPRSLEVQLMNQDAGDFIFIGETVQIYDPNQILTENPGNPDEPMREWHWRMRKTLKEGLEKPAGQWNTMKIISAAERVLVYVNGELANEGFLPSTAKGAFCLQAEKANVEFRNVRIRPADTTKLEHWNPAHR
jgi:hypothetical protein